VPLADASLYETKDNALAMLRDAQSRIIQAVDRLDDSQLDEAFPDESYRDVFPSIRHALTQVLVGHTAYHIGQVTIWRRAMGLPPMGDRLSDGTAQNNAVNRGKGVRNLSLSQQWTSASRPG
jgi:uncharacterized damage-inducible protein DinB